MSKRTGHGWYPYWFPYFGFLLLAQFAPESWAGVMLPIKVAVPLGLLLWFASQGAYEELRGYSWSARDVAMDVALGVALGALWMAPYIVVDAWRPDPEDAFDPEMWGASLVWVVLSIRLVGYGFVTPFMEELFVRSWLLRYVQVLEQPKRWPDFRDVPMAHFTWVSLAIVTAWFTASHVPWEWGVAIPWVVATQLWLYHRKHLMSLVLVHAGSNVGILILVILFNDSFPDGAGHPLSLWFFV